MDTSRSLIGAWMGVQSDKMAFLKLNAKRRKQCITTCGLASSKYSNKRSQNEILTHLASADLPLDAGKVLSELKQLDIVYAGASNIKQMTYVLLRHITTSGVLPKLFNEVIQHLWKPTREAWDDFIRTIGTDRGMQLFLEDLSDLYVKACNVVLLYNPKKAASQPSNLQVEIDEKQYEIDVKHAAKLFKTRWIEVVTSAHPRAVITDELGKKDYKQ